MSALTLPPEVEAVLRAPLHMLAFYRLGRRKAKECLAKRGEPWPPIPVRGDQSSGGREPGLTPPAGLPGQ